MKLEDRLMALPALKTATMKRMFGGTCFMLGEHMVVGTFRDGLLVRVGEDGLAAALQRPGAAPFAMGNRTLRGFVAVAAQALNDDALAEWVDLSLAHVKTLPPKPKARPKR